jgi:nucleoside diphosphate kinase
MLPIEERTIFFVKPYLDKSQALEIVNLLEEKLEDGFTRVLGIRTGRIPKEFWLEFYQHVEAKYPIPYEKMCSEFAGKSIALFIYQGQDITQRIRKIVGPTFYQENIGKGTIRELFADPNISYRTAVHASDREGVDQDFRIFKKWNIIPLEYLTRFK